jgi:hypothetical protein
MGRGTHPVAAQICTCDVQVSLEQPLTLYMIICPSAIAYDMNGKCNGEVRAYKNSLPDGLYDFYIYTIKSLQVHGKPCLVHPDLNNTFTSPSPRKCMTTLWTIPQRTQPKSLLASKSVSGSPSNLASKSGLLYIC